MIVDPTRLRARVIVLAIVSIVLVMTLAEPVLSRRPVLIYNASGSASVGFYRVDGRLPRRGELAVVRPPTMVETMILMRELLPPNVPLLKQVGAVAGDGVCRFGGVVSINGITAAEVLERDSKGRPLPVWEGCLRLGFGQFFLLQPHPYSFDSRYFGPVCECNVIGVAHPLWTWNPGS